MLPLYLPLLCLFSWARAIGLAATPALPARFFPNPPGSGSLYVGQASALRAFFDRGGVIYEAHCAKVRVRYASRHTDLPSSPLQRFVPGIDLKYCVEGDGIKSEFIVRPGADPTQIRLEYDDAEHISIDGRGNLIVRVEGGEWRDEAPVIFQPSGQA